MRRRRERRLREVKCISLRSQRRQRWRSGRGGRGGQDGWWQTLRSQKHETKNVGEGNWKGRKKFKRQGPYNIIVKEWMANNLARWQKRKFKIMAETLVKGLAWACVPGAEARFPLRLIMALRSRRYSTLPCLITLKAQTDAWDHGSRSRSWSMVLWQVVRAIHAGPNNRRGSVPPPWSPMAVNSGQSRAG